MNKLNLKFAPCGVSRWIAAVALLGAGLAAHAAVMIHEFYLPMPEAQIRMTLATLTSTAGTTMETVFSIVSTGPDTVVHYDQWEDGYEVDINNPVQSSTRIWGDGNDANGTPPGYAADPDGLSMGAVLALRNLVSLPRNPATVLYDARDRVAASKAVVVTRAAWATTPGSVLACGVEVQATIDHGTSFIAPVGQDVAAASMFEYAGLFIMADADNTAVTFDVDGAGPAAPVTVTLNRGESHHVNGGVKTGATITATKPIQAHLATGDIGANHESRWFTLYPVPDWYSSYVTPVGTAADGDACYVFAYNPGSAPITLNTRSRVGTGSFTVAAGAVHQWQVPQNSGALLSSAGGEPFFAISTVGANPSANNVHDWGFALVPADALTTEAVVGWGPGSTDLTRNGSPAWIAAEAATTIYVDYNGDHAGPLVDPVGNACDVAYPLAALESKTIYDPDRDQTAMRLYTLDGVLFAAAWGQDPAVAGAGSPFIDMGTAILPFPVPVIHKSSELVEDNGLEGLSIGDVLEYRIEIDNSGLLPLGNTVVLDALPAQLAFVAGTATLDGEALPDDTAGSTPFPLDEAGYTIPIILRGGTSVFTYRTEILASGTILNTASKPQYEISVENAVVVQPPAGSNPGTIAFVNASGAPLAVYPADGPVYVRLADADANADPGSAETVTVFVQNTTNGDVEPLVLTETGPDTGVFTSLAPLPASASAGLAPEDGTLHAQPGDALATSHLDPVYGDFCSATALVSAGGVFKPLYLTEDAADGDTTGGLDRRDPVATGDATTAETATLGSSGPATLEIVGAAAAVSTAQRASSHTFTYNSGSAGDNRLLVVGISYRNDDYETVSSVTYGGQALTQIGTAANSDDGRVHLYRLLAPPTGNNALVVTWSSALDQGGVIGAVTYAGVDPSEPTGAFGSATGSSSTPTATVASQAGDVVIGVVAGPSTSNYSATGGGTPLWSLRPFSGQTAGAGQAKPGADSSVALSWSGSSAPWAVGGVALKPATVTTGGAAATFLQSPAFCKDFVMPAGGALTVRNYVHLAGGTLPADPNLTAFVANGATPLATLVNPTATLVSGGAAGIAQAANSSSSSASTSSLSFSHTPGSGANRLLVVAIGVGATTPTGNPPTVSGVTFGGTPLTPVISRVSGVGGAGDDTISYLYQLVNPASGPANVVVSLGGAGSLAVGATTFTGVDPSAPLGTPVSAAGTSGGTASVAVPSAPGQLVVGTVSWDEDPVIGVDAAQSSLWNLTGAAGSGAVSAAASTQPGGAAVTHRYTSDGTQDWAILAVPLLPSASDSVYAIDWSLALPAETTVPSGQAIGLSVSNATGVALSILYDSEDYPSVVSLPASSIIAIDSLAFYDAPHPGGSPVASATAGSTVYVRATVSDPFGAYDVTGLDLSIASIGLDVALGEDDVVAGTACSKTYEYAWQPPAEGAYALAATAHEGTEGVTAAAAAALDVSFLDTGTPGEVVFTAGDDGVATNRYEADQTVAVRVTDFDQNANPAIAETVTVVVSTAGGDVETVVLTETGPDTGVFTATLPASSTVEGADEDGTLHLPPGAQLVVSYADPTDPADQSSASAVVPLPEGVPGLAVTKTRLLPADGQALLGEPVRFAITVANIGSVALPAVALADAYPAAVLAYQAAEPAPDSAGGGTAVWGDLGALAPGQSATVVVDFLAAATSALATNTATASADGGVSAFGFDTVSIVQPALAVTKTILSPVPGPAAVGDTVQYRVVVANTGTTAIALLPLEDTFSAAYLQYASATIPPDGVGAGSLLWTNLTASAALAVGAAITNDVSLLVVGGGDPAVNLAQAAYAEDVFGNPVPPAEDAADIVTRAVSISGAVFNDLDTNGVFSAGDTGLAGVSVTLWSDPDGDGDPADGAIVRVGATLADGAYEFLNLPLGRYVVVESDLAGYASSGDAAGANDNRIPVNASSLDAYDDLDFFDYKPRLVDYATISGTVHLDANANGLVDDGVGAVIAGVPVQLVQDVNTNGVADPGEPVVQTSQTGADGTYRFGGVVAGSYVVLQTDLPGHVSLGDAQGANDNAIAIAVAGGAASSGNDFLDVKTARLGDFVWLDANANGLQDVGEAGISGVVVNLYDGSAALLATTTTGVGGAYAFVGLLPGDYCVGFEAPSGHVFSTIDAGDDGADSDADTATGLAAVRALASGQTDNAVDAGLYRPASIAGTVWLDADGDGVRDAGENTGVAGATVALFDAATNFLDSVLSAADGTFAFDNLPPGDYILVQTLPQGYQATSSVSLSFSLASGDAATAVYLDLPAFSIGNHVFRDANNDGIRDFGDEGLAAVSLALFAADAQGSPTGAVLRTQATDEQGDYRFDGLREGRYVVVVDVAASAALSGLASSSGHSESLSLVGDMLDHGIDTPLGSQSVLPGGIAAAAVQVGPGLQPLGELVAGDGDLGAHGPTGDAGDNLVVDFSFTPVYSLGNRVFLDDDGDLYQDEGEAGAPGVPMLAFAADANGRPTGAPLAAATTDSNGWYRLDNLVKGTYVVVLDRQAAVAANPDLLPYTSTIGTTNDMTLAADRYDHGWYHPLVNLGPVTNGYASGPVTLGVDLQPLGEARSGAAGAGDNSPYGDARDNLVVDFGLVPTFCLGNRVFRDDGAGGGIAGNGVLDGSEAGISNVALRVFAADGNGSPTGDPLIIGTDDLDVAMTDPNGWYRFFRLAPGTYVVVVDVGLSTNLTGYAFMNGSTWVMPGATSSSLVGYTSSLGQSTDTTLDGDGHDHGGDEPVSLGVVQYGIAGPAVTLGEGFQPLGEATNALTGAASHAPAGDAYDNLVMDFGFTPTFSLGNRVFWDNGADGGVTNNAVQDGGEPGIAGVVVQVRTNGVVLATTQTDADGYYRFDLLPAGTYTVFIPPANFDLDGALSGKVGSIGTAAGDRGDKGVQSLVVDGVSSASVTLGEGLQPIGETDVTVSGAGAAGSHGDAYDNLTLDFGFVDPNALRTGVGSLVWHDANNNGSFDSGESGIPAVTLEAWACEPDGTLIDTSPAATAVSASDGTYLLCNIEPGHYRLAIPAVNFATGEALENLPAASTLRKQVDNQVDNDSNAMQEAPGASAWSPVVHLVRGGEPVDGAGPNDESGPGALQDSVQDANGDMTVDFGFYSPADDQAVLCSLGSLVWSDLDNDGIQDAAEPGLAGVRIDLYLTNATGRALWASTNSAVDGTFFFGDLPGGAVWLLNIPATNFVADGPLFDTPFASQTASASDDQTDGDSNALQPGGLGDEVWSPAISLVAGAEPTSAETAAGGALDDSAPLVDANGDMTVDFGFTPVYSLGNRVFADLDNDGVMDVSETGIADVLVVLFAADGSGDPVGSPRGTVVTDADGHYRFDNLVAGGYVPVVDVAASSALAHWRSSAGASVDASLAGDGLDHGRDAPVNVGGIVGGVAGPSIALGYAAQPTGESVGTGAGANGPTGDARDNLVADFGFTPTYSIGNRVFRDLNNDGLLSLASLDSGGLSNVVLSIFLADGEGEPTGTALQAGSSDENGFYRFDGLLPGTYVVVADPTLSPTLAGLLSSTGVSTNLTVAGDRQDHGNDAPLGELSALPGGIASVPVTVGYGLQPLQEAEGPGLGSYGPLGDAFDNLVLDFGFHPLYSLGNRVFLDAANDGFLDGADSGIVGASLSLFASDAYGTPLGDALATTQSGFGGFYRFDGLTGGTYVVSIALSGPLDGHVGSTGASADTTVSGDNADHGLDEPVEGVILSGPVKLGVDGTAAPIGESVADGGANGPNGDKADSLVLDFGFYQPVSIAGSVRVDVNGDGVLDAGETSGIGGVEIRLFDGSGAIMATTTAADGSFTFTNLPPGTYTVVETVPSGWYATGDTDGANDNAIALTLTSGQTSSGNVFLDAQRAVIESLVWNDLDGDGALDAFEDGIAGVRVYLDLDGDGGYDEGEPASFTDATGTYAIADLLVGVYTARVDVATLPQDYAQTHDLNGALDHAAYVALVSGAMRDDVDFGYRSEEGFTVAGQIRDDYDADGDLDAPDRPVGGVRVSLYTDPNGDGDPSDGELAASTTTGADGVYTFSDVPGGAYVIVQTPPPSAVGTGDADGGTDSRISILVDGADALAQDFLVAVDPAGYLYDVTDGSILAGGAIAVSGPGAVVLMDGSTGQYSFITTNEAGGTFTLAVTPPPGYVLDTSRPVAGASFDPTGLADPVVLGSGENSAEPGYLVDASAVGNSYYLVFELAPGDPAVLNNNIPFVKPASIGDFVWNDLNSNGLQDDGEAGLADVEVSLFHVVDGPSGTTTNLVGATTTDSLGRYAFSVLPDAAYLLRVDAPDGYAFSPLAMGGSDGLDSDFGPANPYSGVFSIAAGEDNVSFDAGLYYAPTLSVITSFRAYAQGGHVFVAWETAAEYDTIGYWIDRFENGAWVRLNPEEPVWSEMTGRPASYTLADPGAAPGGTHTWRIVEIEGSGAENVYGPYTVAVDGAAADYDAWAAGVAWNGAAAGRDDDPDGDGLSNFEEFLAGTDPLNANSVLKITGIRPVANGIEIRWASVAGKAYAVEHTRTLGGAWLPVKTGLVAEGAETRFTLPGADGGFFRVVVKED